ncbi:MAG TPA: hypothetical protein VHB72_05050 [Candidatus Saccharimonadales bacterium]|nr:hypothetical protein [Candidatus Saccharimonadales bacterium]
MSPEILDTSFHAFTEEELGIRFDELIELSASQPDDELALHSLREVVLEARDRGQIDMAFQMAMTLGAMACLHPHMEGLANSAGEQLGLLGGAGNEHGDENDAHEHEDAHDPAKCEACRSGKPCARKR